MTTQIIPGIRKLNGRQGKRSEVLPDVAEIGKIHGQKGTLPTTLVWEGEKGENGTLEAQITNVNVYDYALEFLQPMADWLDRGPGRHLRIGGRHCFSLEEVVRALLEAA